VRRGSGSTATELDALLEKDGHKNESSVQHPLAGMTRCSAAEPLSRFMYRAK